MWPFVTDFSRMFTVFTHVVALVYTFYWGIIFYCMYRPYLTNPFINRWAFKLFPLWGYYEQCYKHSFTSFCVDMFSFLLSEYFLDQTLCTNVWGTAKWFSNMKVSFYLLISDVWAFLRLYILGNNCYCIFVIWLFLWVCTGI